MDLNMCETLSTCTYFEESVPGPSTIINSDTFVQSINNTQSNTEAPRGSLLPCSLKIMDYLPKSLKKKLPQLPESILPLLPKSLKLIQLLPKSPKILVNFPWNVFYLPMIKFTNLKTAKLNRGTWLNVHLICCIIHVKTRLSHVIHTNDYLNEILSHVNQIGIQLCECSHTRIFELASGFV